MNYQEFLRQKVALEKSTGLPCGPLEVNPLLKPHQVDSVVWAVSGGRRALFEAFGLGKTLMQLEYERLILSKTGGGLGLIVAPLGVRQEFKRDAAMLKTPLSFVRTDAEVSDDGIYLTNYESVRDGKIDPRRFKVVSLDEAAILRGFGGTKTFREFMAVMAGDDRRDQANRIKSDGIPYRLVATATPSPNEYIELLAYAAFLGVMDVGQAKTRFFKRDSTKADKLTIHAHKEEEFWLWVASWALFIQRPSDLGHSDEGYELPPLDVRWHEVKTDHRNAGHDRDGQGKLLKDTAIGVQDAAREKRDSLPLRIKAMQKIRAEEPGEHRIIWHDLEDERRAIEAAIPSVVSVYGAQDDDAKEKAIIDFAEGRTAELAGKPVMLGAGVNLQRHCARAIFLGIGFKFADFIQACHRIRRFLQKRQVRIDLIYTEAEREVRRQLERKWKQHNDLVANMTAIIKKYGLAQNALNSAMKRTFGVTRTEVSGEGWTVAHNDCVEETALLKSDSLGLVLTSVPFATQYEYSPSYNDFGHTDDEAHFFRQMDFLTPELYRALKPGRILAVHVKDRIKPSGLTGLGFQTVTPFSDMCVAHYTKHGFGFLARKTIVTDVVRENAQTYRLGWTEQCKDGSRMGNGMPEYLLIFRKPPTDRSNGYADEPVVKDKAVYTRARWQFDAHGFQRSSGDRLLVPEDFKGVSSAMVFKMFRQHSASTVYNIKHDVELAEVLDAMKMLPPSFMLLQPVSHHQDVWTDITRMRTLNGEQAAKGKEMHLCLARGSRVLTRVRGYIPIQEVKVGEYALTHRGRWRRVLAVQNTGVRDTITVCAQGVPGITLTPDHKLWIRSSDWVRESEGARRNSPAWIEAKKSLSGYVNLQLPPIEDAVEKDCLKWWIVGRWIADGHWEKRGAAMISCGDHKINSLKSKLGIRAGGVYHTGTSFQVRVLDPDGSIKRILHRCGRGAENKHLPPEAFSLPFQQAEALLSGYLSGDGHLVKHRQRWMVTAVSRDLLLGLAFLAQRVYGAIACIYPGRPARETLIEGRRVRCKQEWIFSFDQNKTRRKKPFILSDGAWKKVRKIMDAGQQETWNIRVDEDESYTAEGCIVKNCPLQFDIVDRAIEQYTNPGDEVYDPFGGLMTVPLRAVDLGRRGRAAELSLPYFTDGVWHLQRGEAKAKSPTLFDLTEAA